MKNISQAKLRRVSVPLPRLDLQIAFAEKIYSIEAIVRHLDAAAAKAEAVTAALLRSCSIAPRTLAPPSNNRLRNEARFCALLRA
jgi:hypothetical protein